MKINCFSSGEELKAYDMLRIERANPSIQYVIDVITRANSTNTLVNRQVWGTRTRSTYRYTFQWTPNNLYATVAYIKMIVENTMNSISNDEITEYIKKTVSEHFKKNADNMAAGQLILGLVLMFYLLFTGYCCSNADTGGMMLVMLFISVVSLVSLFFVIGSGNTKWFIAKAKSDSISLEDCIRLHDYYNKRSHRQIAWIIVASLFLGLNFLLVILTNK